MEKKFGVLSSSVNPQQLSLLVQAGARALLGLLVTLGYFQAVNVDQAIEEIPALVLMGYTAWQALEALFGGVRKAIVAFTTK